MAFIHNEVGRIIPSNLRSEALSNLRCLNRLIDNSDTGDSQFEEIINELKFLKSQIASFPSDISTIYGTNNLGREMTEDSILIANINDALFRAENIVKQQNSENFKFDGNPVEWFRFLEIFEKTVHNRSYISDALKFKYLKSMLEGSALEKVKELPLHDSSYLKALELLKLSFKNEQVLIEAHLCALCDLEAPKGLPESLSKFRSELAYHMRALNTLKSDFEESSGFIIVALLKRKLPKETQDRIRKNNKYDFWSISKFVDALNYEIEFLSGVKYANEILGQPQNSNPNRKNIPLMNEGENEQLLNYLNRREINVDIKRQLTQNKNVDIERSIGRVNDEERKQNGGNKKNSNANAQKFIPRLMNVDLRNYLTNIEGNVNERNQDRENKRKIKQKQIGNVKRTKIVNEEQKKQNGGNQKKAPEKFNEGKGNLSKKLNNCKFCGSSHFERSCKIYKTGLERRQRAVQRQLCLHCLSDSHTTKECEAKLECKFCTGRHIHAICLNLGKQSMGSKAKSGKRSNISSRLQFPTSGTK